MPAHSKMSCADAAAAGANAVKHFAVIYVCGLC